MANILHLTDFHARPDDRGSHLREKRYKEYVTEFCHAVREVSPVLDAVIITGDFVNVGETHNFPYCSAIVDELVGKLSVPKEKFAVCIGNHDFSREAHKSNGAAKAREPFESFAAQFGNGKALKSSQRGKLWNLTRGLHALMLDSTWGNDPALPGDLDPEEIDDIVSWVEKLPGTEILVVGAHFPALFAQDNVSDALEDDIDYNKKHEWKRGKVLRERIIRMRALKEAPTIWLAGDIHHQEQIALGYRQYFVTTGHFGGSILEASSPQFRQAKLIRIGDEDDSITTFNFTPRGHHENPHVGDWVPYTSGFRRSTLFDRSAPRTVESVRVPAMGDPADSEYDQVVISEERDASAVPVTPVADGALNERLLELVRSLNLYTIGRFHTNSHHTCISWVSVGPLMSEPGLLGSIIDGACSWVKSVIEEVDIRRALLVGVDCWGTILASNMSVSLGIENICIAARGRGNFSSPQEGITHSYLDAVKAADAVFFITDVIATGHTLSWLYEETIKKLGIDRPSLVWFACAVFYDSVPDRADRIAFLDRIGVCCSSLRMPILPADSMPSEDIQRPTVSFLN